LLTTAKNIQVNRLIKRTGIGNNRATSFGVLHLCLFCTGRTEQNARRPLGCIQRAPARNPNASSMERGRLPRESAAARRYFT